MRIDVPQAPPPGGLAENQLAIRRATARLCAQLGWASLHEVPLANGRRADILALRPDGGFACIEVKSGVRDFLADSKWPDYRAYCDTLYFAVDEAFPRALLPQDTGLVVACLGEAECRRPGAAEGFLHEAELVREAPVHALSPSRRRALLQRFATLAASRLALLEDPAITASLRAALRAE